MYMTPTRGASPAHKRAQVAEGPIFDFCEVIESTPSEEWQKRTLALRQLVDIIPVGSAYTEGSAWYNTPPILRHLANPISELLKDARSTVVKRACESLTALFNKCQSDARYLFKDIMQTILAVHAQTVQVIRQAVQSMVMESIAEVPCKMVMPLWMERLKVDKSRTVREACSLYLGQALKCWTEEGYLTQEIWLQVGSTLIRTLRDPSPSVRANAKSALDWIRVSQPEYWNTLINGPEAPASRDLKLQKWLRSLGQHGNETTDDLSVVSKISFNSDTRYAQTRSSPAASSRPSPTNKRWLEKIPSSNEIDPENGVPTSIGISVNTGTLDADDVNEILKEEPVIKDPTPASRFRRIGGRLGPPLRPAAPFQQAIDSPSSQRPSVGTPPRPPMAAAQRLTVGAPLDPIEGSTHNDEYHEDIGQVQGETTARDQPSSPESEPSLAFPADLNHAFDNAPSENAVDRTSSPEQNNVKSSSYEQKSFDNVPSERSTNNSPPSPEPGKNSSRENEKDSTRVFAFGEAKDRNVAEQGNPTEGPFIASMQELKKHASKRRSRNSLLMKERFRSSSSNLLSVSENGEESERNMSESQSQEENEAPNSEPPKEVVKPPIQAPEHMVIAIRLLRSHKEHVDQIMETLKIEMDTLRDFDRLLEEPGRPTEEEVLDYFESVGLCLDQRTQAGVQLQREMDRISRGQPPV